MENKLLDAENNAEPKLRSKTIDFLEAYILLAFGGLFLYLTYVNWADSLLNGGITGKTIGDSIGMAMCILPPAIYTFSWRKESILMDRSDQKWDIYGSWHGIMVYILMIECLSAFVVGVMSISMEKMSELYGEWIVLIGIGILISGLVLSFYLYTTKTRWDALMAYWNSLPAEEFQQIWIEKKPTND